MTTMHERATAKIRAREPFTERTMMGAPGGGLPPGHRLPEPYAGQYALLVAANLVRYTVYSYNTPIAWLLDHGTVIVPEVTYSPTTTQHQYTARAALA